MDGVDIKQTGVIIDVDKHRRLNFDLNAFCDLEDKYGSIEKAMKELQKGSIRAIRYMLYLGLLGDDESLTEKKVGKLININNLQDIMQKLTLSITIATPKVDEKN